MHLQRQNANLGYGGNDVIVGYGQSLEGEADADGDVAYLQTIGAERLFLAEAPEETDSTLQLAISFLRPGDVFSISTLGRLGSSLECIVEALGQIAKSGAVIRIGDADVGPGTALGDALLPVSRYLAERMRSSGRSAGEPGARDDDDSDPEPRRRGRPSVLTHAQRERVQRLINEQGIPTRQVAKRFGVSTATIYRILQTPPWPD